MAKSREEKLDEVAEILTEAYARYAKEIGFRKVSDSKFARHLGITNQSLSTYLQKTRIPDLEAALKLSEHPLIGMRIFDACDYPRLAKINDDRLWYIIKTWKGLTSDEREQFVGRMEELLASERQPGDYGKGNAAPLRHPKLAKTKQKPAKLPDVPDMANK